MFVCFFILTDSKTGNDSYIYISNTSTWFKAQSYCRQYHTDLVSVRNTTEDTIIKGLITGFTWIGLFRDSWKWSDKSNVSIITWMSGKPDNSLGNEDCGYLNNSQAADARCSDIMPFFCYSGELMDYSVLNLDKFLTSFKMEVYLCVHDCVYMLLCISTSRHVKKTIFHKSENPVQSGSEQSGTKGSHLGAGRFYPPQAPLILYIPLLITAKVL